jgi:hypothetical protein
VLIRFFLSTGRFDEAEQHLESVEQNLSYTLEADRPCNTAATVPPSHRQTADLTSNYSTTNYSTTAADDLVASLAGPETDAAQSLLLAGHKLLLLPCGIDRIIGGTTAVAERVDSDSITTRLPINRLSVTVAHGKRLLCDALTLLSTVLTLQGKLSESGRRLSLALRLERDLHGHDSIQVVDSC